MTNFYTESIENFFSAVLKLNSSEDCQKFFEDICTIKELQEISQRLSVAKMLDEGKSYQEVSRLTGASTATISRVNKCLVYGSGGYRQMLDKLNEEKSEQSE